MGNSQGQNKIKLQIIDQVSGWLHAQNWKKKLKERINQTLAYIKKKRRKQ